MPMAALSASHVPTGGDTSAHDNAADAPANAHERHRSAASLILCARRRAQFAQPETRRHRCRYSGHAIARILMLARWASAGKSLEGGPP